MISTNDAVGKVLGEEHSGRVRCLGLGAVPTGSFRKPRFQVQGATNPTFVSEPPPQYQQELSQVRVTCDSLRDTCHSLRDAFKSYLIMKEGHVPEQFAGIFSSPASTVILISVMLILKLYHYCHAIEIFYAWSLLQYLLLLMTFVISYNYLLVHA